MRTFISLNPDEPVRKKISEIQNYVKEKISDLNPEFLNSIKWEPENKFHLTLFFIGETDENKVSVIHSGLKKLESGISFKEINFKLKSINAFPKLKYPRVLILELDNEDKKVFELSNKINSVLKEIGFENDKLFHPHFTIGRIKRDHKINLTKLENNIEIDLNFYVNKFFLMESKLKKDGSEYSVIDDYKI
jgi:RNA 2',3'-cyclic 3'-phosphodiesterase